MRVQPAGDRSRRATRHHLEDHGCRPRPPAASEQVGLEQVRSDLAIGERPERQAEEVQLHAPLKRERHVPVAVDPATEATLREHLCVKAVPEPRHARPFRLTAVPGRGYPSLERSPESSPLPASVSVDAPSREEPRCELASSDAPRGDASCGEVRRLGSERCSDVEVSSDSSRCDLLSDDVSSVDRPRVPSGVAVRAVPGRPLGRASVRGVGPRGAVFRLRRARRAAFGGRTVLGLFAVGSVVR